MEFLCSSVCICEDKTILSSGGKKDHRKGSTRRNSLNTTLQGGSIMDDLVEQYQRKTWFSIRVCHRPCKCLLYSEKSLNFVIRKACYTILLPCWYDEGNQTMPSIGTLLLSYNGEYEKKHLQRWPQHVIHVRFMFWPWILQLVYSPVQKCCI